MHMEVESRGACWKCGVEVTTAHVRSKDAHGRYAHVDCGTPFPGGASAAGKGAASAAVPEVDEECFAYTAKKKRRRVCGGEGSAFHDMGAGAAAKAAGAHDDCDTAIVIRDGDEENGGDARGPGMATSPGRMNIYDEPPRGAISLREFEEYALDRLHVLKGFDVGKAGGLKSEEVSASIEQLCSRYLPQEDLHKDHVSHYILRMAFSRAADQRRWFLRQEKRLFKHRFSAMRPEGRALAMQQLQAATSSEPFVSVSEGDFNELREQLLGVFGESSVRACCHEGSQAVSQRTLRDASQPWLHIYRVPFERVPDLVAQRRAFLWQGWAYLTCRDLASAAAGLFCESISRRLEDHARVFASKISADDERLTPILDRITRVFLVVPAAAAAGDGAGAAAPVIRERLPEVMSDSAPLCMQSSYDILIEKQHLKHNARRQLTLFFKAVGLPLEDCLAFWQANLKQKAQDFDKRYAYNIRHLYGAVGACKDYPAFSCDDLIESRKGLNPPSGQCGHGCPYKHWDDARLRQTLASSRLAPLDIEDVCKLAAEGRYQRACQRHFEVRHPFCAHLKDTVNHPNQYFRASVDYHAGMRGASAAGVGSPGEELEESDDEDAENGSGDEQVLAHSCRLDQDA